MTAVPPADRRFQRLLADAALQGQVEGSGYVVVGPVLDPTDLAELGRCHDTLAADLTTVAAGHWYTSGALGSPELRRRVYEAAGQVVVPAVERVVAADVTVLGSNFHVNPPNSTAGLGPHQDVALVDEREASTMNGWIPLQDTDLEVGPLHVVPGSHLLGNRDRSLAVPWAFEGLHDVFWDHAVPVQVPAGHLVVFDTALVHCSTPNRTAADRLAVNCLLIPADVPLQHLVAAGDAGGQVDVYEVDVEFLVSGDLFGPPDPSLGAWRECRPVHVPIRDRATVDAFVGAFTGRA